MTEQAHQDILEAEAEAIRRFRAATRSAEQTNGDIDFAETMLAAVLARGWVRAIERAQTKARLTVIEELEPELGTAQLGPLARLRGFMPGDLPVPGAVRAERYARRTARRWARAASEARGDGASLRQARRFASRSVTPYGRMVAVTEVSASYNAERAQVARDYQRQTGTTVWLAWNAELDRRTCPECESLDGERVAAVDGWRGAGPGDIHPRCRCTSTIEVDGL